jgi:hypothetical protein
VHTLLLLLLLGVFSTSLEIFSSNPTLFGIQNGCEFSDFCFLTTSLPLEIPFVSNKNKKQSFMEKFKGVSSARKP